MNINLINKTILVTGGAGFIGSNLCEALVAKQNKVICLDNFATGKIENIEQLLKDPNFLLIEGDIRKLDRFHVTRIISRGGTILGSARFPEFAQREVRQQHLKLTC
mgnify:CR=1 FL=1